jgi:iron complex transport system ATP-binding protein
VTVLYVTHHADEILPFFTHALLMKQGKIHSQGKIKEVLADHTLSDLFEQPTEVFWMKDRVQFKIRDDYKMNKAIWNRE